MNEIISILKKLRIIVLKSSEFGLYNEIVDFLRQPHEIEEVCIKDIKGIDISTDENYISNLKRILYKLYIEYPDEYYKYIKCGQCYIWDSVGKTYAQLLSMKNEIENLNIDLIDDSYVLACREVNKVICKLSRAFSVVTNFEREMGLDRFLSFMNKKDLDLLHKSVQEIKTLTNKKLTFYKDVFQMKWNITEVSKLMEHMLISEIKNSPVVRNFPSSQNRVILFLIDGLGYSQYLWNKEVFKRNESYTFNDNIFNVLEGEKDYIQSYILGSSLISDTGAGLGEIFTGKLPSETGIISSKFKVKNYCNESNKTNPIIPIKRCSYNFDKIVNAIESKSFLNRIVEERINTNVYYCSKYSSNEYSRLCFGDSKIKQVLPPERVYSILYDDMIKEDNNGLYCVYYTSLDNSGHPMGAFTSFEFFEHQKINYLFTSFIIKLALDNPKFFDGKTSIVITADHGMAETSKKIISRYAFEELYGEYIVGRSSIIENNRAILFYDVIANKLHETAKKVKSIFNEFNIEAEVFTKEDNIFKKIIYNEFNFYSENNSPDIIALIEGEGIVFSQELNTNLFHFGGHGGRSSEEVFVPLICINFTEKIKDRIIERFVKFI